MGQVLKRVYVWQLPVRVTHWVNALSIAVLSLTGYYIGAPFMHAHAETQYIMGWMRFIHFTSAYVFVMSLAVRVYWSFMGNAYAGWREFFPFSPKKSEKMIMQIMQYSLVSERPTFTVGHTPLAGMTYLLIFVLYLVEIFTGFALYSESNPAGFYSMVFGWQLIVFSAQTIRLIHHLVMWLLVYFVLIHIYTAVFVDTIEKSGLMGSIFTGYKFVYPEVKVRD